MPVSLKQIKQLELRILKEGMHVREDLVQQLNGYLQLIIDSTRMGTVIII